MTSNTHVVNCHCNRFDIYIGRGDAVKCPWGNPFVMKNKTTVERKRVIAEYDKWLDTQPILLARLPELVGKTLGCFCAPKECHGEVLVRRCNQLVASSTTAAPAEPSKAKPNASNKRKFDTDNKSNMSDQVEKKSHVSSDVEAKKIVITSPIGWIESGWFGYDPRGRKSAVFEKTPVWRATPEFLSRSDILPLENARQEASAVEQRDSKAIKNLLYPKEEKKDKEDESNDFALDNSTDSDDGEDEAEMSRKELGRKIKRYEKHLRTMKLKHEHFDKWKSLVKSCEEVDTRTDELTEQIIDKTDQAKEFLERYPDSSKAQKAQKAAKTSTFVGR